MRTGIFAKHGTQEKVMMKYSFQQLPGIVKQLGERYGGNWACVDDLKENEFVTITDSQVYKGFNQDSERYFDFEKFDHIEILIKEESV